MLFEAVKGLTRNERRTVAAAYLGWTLDAFDFFLLVFVLTDIAHAFAVSVTAVTWAITLTLALRPVGAFLFGQLADRYGRKPVMMIDVLLYALFGFATAFVPNFTIFLIVRALFGIAMGGEWGVAASLTMESISPRFRGLVSGLLQAGYPSGLLLASAVYALLFAYIGWRGMFVVGLLPAILVLYIRRYVKESPAWQREAAKRAPGTAAVIRKHWKLALFAIMFMTGMNFFSHGTQDLYPIFLKIERGLDPRWIGTINIAAAVGAILGGLVFGALSQRIGRCRGLMSSALLAIPIIPFWVLAPTTSLLVLAAFLMQFMVQGCWGIIPAHLNELSPPEARGTFPGVVYQLGNFLASYTAVLQAGLAASYGSYALSLAAVAVGAGIMIAVFAYFGGDATHIDLAISDSDGRADASGDGKAESSQLNAPMIAK